MAEPVDVSPKSPQPQEYCGDGVYVQFVNGFQLEVRVNDHRSMPVVYLEQFVLQSLVDYARRSGMVIR